MVLLERYGHGDADGKVGPHAKEPVGRRVVVSEYHVVRYVVDGEGEGVVDDSAQGVGQYKDPHQGQLSDVVRRNYVKDDHS